MTDDKFQSLLNRTAKAKNKFYDTLIKARREYFERFGCMPEEIEDNFWMSRFEKYGEAGADVLEVETYNKIYNDRYHDKNI